MAELSRKDILSAAVIVGVLVALGLAVGGYCVGKGAVRFRSDIRTVTVKGLVEKEVKSDRAVWTLPFRRAGNDLRDVYEKIRVDREAAIRFLEKQGFAREEIAVQPPRTIDKLAREYDPSQGPDKLRYLVTASLVVDTPNVDLVHKSLGATEELLGAGVVLDGESQGGSANPRYMVTAFNALRPALLAEATKNARATAKQFASDSGAVVGKIRTANQGSIQIFGADGNDESGGYGATSTLMKKIRVVSTFEFELK